MMTLNTFFSSEIGNMLNDGVEMIWANRNSMTYHIIAASTNLEMTGKWWRHA